MNVWHQYRNRWAQKRTLGKKMRHREAMWSRMKDIRGDKITRCGCIQPKPVQWCTRELTAASFHRVRVLNSSLRSWQQFTFPINIDSPNVTKWYMLSSPRNQHHLRQPEDGGHSTRHVAGVNVRDGEKQRVAGRMQIRLGFGPLTRRTPQATSVAVMISTGLYSFHFKQWLVTSSIIQDVRAFFQSRLIMLRSGLRLDP